MITCRDWVEEKITLCRKLARVRGRTRFDIEELLLKVTGKLHTHTLISGDLVDLTREQLSSLEELFGSYISGVPLSYLTGRCEFWSVDLKITRRTFVPRADTECMIEFILQSVPRCSAVSVLDLGSGSGAIALALAHERPNWVLTGVDRFANLVRLASQNAALLGVRNVSFMKSNWFSSIGESKYDLVVSNPPYVSRKDSNNIRHEARSALISGDSGLKDISIICSQSPPHLKKNGWIVLEHGCMQGKGVRRLLHRSGFAEVDTGKDLALRERFSFGRMR